MFIGYLKSKLESKSLPIPEFSGSYWAQDLKASARVVIPYPTLPNLRPNSDDSLCHVVDSWEILGLTYGVRPNENKTDDGWFLWRIRRIRLNVESFSHQNPECANENPPNTILNRFYELNFSRIRYNSNPKAQTVNKAQRQLRPKSYFLEFYKSTAQVFDNLIWRNLYFNT